MIGSDGGDGGDAGGDGDDGGDGGDVNDSLMMFGSVILRCTHVVFRSSDVVDCVFNLDTA